MEVTWQQFWEILIIGITSARLKYSFTETYQEHEDGTIEFLSSGTFRLYKVMEVDMWGISAGGPGASNSYINSEDGPGGGGGVYSPKGLQGKGAPGLLLIHPTQF